MNEYPVMIWGFVCVCFNVALVLGLGLALNLQQSFCSVFQGLGS